MSDSKFFEMARRLRLGPGLAVLGAAVLLVGLFQTTAASTQVGCPEGTTLLAKFEFNDGGYDFEKPDGNTGIVSISDASATGGQWSSSIPVAATVIKGGTGSMTTWIDPPQTSGTFSNAGLPLVGDDNLPDISNIKFCRPIEIATTTIPDTTTTADTTTTTPDTTTTAGDTTTTAPDTTTTEITTTTIPETTTTTAEITSVPPVTSTSMAVDVAGEDELAFTGLSATPIIILGIVLLGTGLFITALTGSHSRRAS